MTAQEFSGARDGEATGAEIIELELRPDELQRLAQADSPSKPVSRSASYSIKIALILCVTAAAALLAIGILRPSKPPAKAVTPAVAPAPIPEPPLPVKSEPPPVHFTNPFDASEVFEFPAGTSEAEARDSVAKVLMERARGRLDSLPRFKRVRRPHSTSPPDAVTARNVSDARGG